MTTTPANSSAISGAKSAPNLRLAQTPHNSEVEQALLGLLLANSEKIYWQVNELVAAADFYDPLHERIFTAIAATVESGRVADARTLRGQFDTDAALKASGGAKYLAELAACVVSFSNAQDYARTVHDLATRRRLMQFAQDVNGLALDQTAPPQDSEQLVSAAETKLFSIAERRGQNGAVDMPTAWNETMARIEAAQKRGGGLLGISTGLTKLDEMIGGLQAGFLHTLAGRPSMGKTALGLTIAANAAMAGHKVVFHSLEMERTDIVARLIARQTGIPANKQRGELSSDDWRKIVDAGGVINAWPLHVDHDSSLTFSQIRGRTLRHKRRHGCDLLVIDYLGLITASNPDLNRNYQIEEITKGLKTMAKELGIPVLLLAQLNRGLEQRDDKRPMMSDLRDSGSIEQDSDVIGFIYRDEYYLTKSEPVQGDKESEEKFGNRYTQWQQRVEKSRGRADVIIAKNRQGETGTVNLRWQGWRCHFFDDDGQPQHGDTRGQ